MAWDNAFEFRRQLLELRSRSHAGSAAFYLKLWEHRIRRAGIAYADAFLEACTDQTRDLWPWAEGLQRRLHGLQRAAAGHPRLAAAGRVLLFAAIDLEESARQGITVEQLWFRVARLRSDPVVAASFASVWAGLYGGDILTVYRALGAGSNPELVQSTVAALLRTASYYTRHRLCLMADHDMFGA